MSALRKVRADRPNEMVLDIRVMDESFIVWRKMFHAPLTADSLKRQTPNTSPQAGLTAVSMSLESFSANRFGLLAIAWCSRGIEYNKNYLMACDL